MSGNSMAVPRTVRGAIRWAETQLAAADVYCGHGTDNARDEAAWLVGGALGLAPADVNDRLEAELNAAARERVQQLVAQRIGTRKPTAYLLQQAWFAGLPFHVDQRVLIPRSLTAEFIAERFAPWLEATRVRRILDLCTGSGCMAVTCALAFPHARVDAADVSADALAVARRNVERHGVGSRVRLVHSDLFQALARARYDVIVTNPPYVARAELERLPPEYAFEPVLALAAGADGLEIAWRILRDAPTHLDSGGILIMEVGNGREALEHLLPEVPFVWLTTTTGDESVFLLTAEQLAEHRRRFRDHAGNI